MRLCCYTAAGNIAVTDAVRFADRCEVCYTCVHNCPKNAIHLKSERSAARFRNEHVPLKEIIAANGESICGSMDLQ